MTEPFKFVVSNDPAKARQAIGTLGVPADYDVSGSGDYMVNDVVRYTDPAPSPTTDLTGLYACITDHTAGSPKDYPARWSRVASQSWAGLSGKPAVAVVWQAATAYAAGQILRHPTTGQWLSRTTSGTSRGSFDATERALWRVLNPTNLGFPVNVLDYGVTGDGTTDDTTAIQAVFDAFPNAHITFPGFTADPSGAATYSYKITTAINITGDPNITVAAGARVFAAASMTYLWQYKTTRTPGPISNLTTGKSIRIDGTLDGAGLASDVLRVDMMWNCKVRGDGRIQDCATNGRGLVIGLSGYGAEVFVDDLFVINTLGQTGTTGVLNLNADNHITNVVPVDHNVGVDDQGAAALTRVHPWIKTSALIPNSVGFKLTGNSLLEQCNADTFQYPYRVISGWPRLIACRLLFNSSIYTNTLVGTNPPVLFQVDSGYVTLIAAYVDATGVSSATWSNNGQLVYSVQTATQGTITGFHDVMQGTPELVGFNYRLYGGFRGYTGAYGSPGTGHITAVGNVIAGKELNANDTGELAYNGRVIADSVMPDVASTATAGGTTTLTSTSKQQQEFTGSSAQTVVLPSTGVVHGQSWIITNFSSTSITINSSAGGGVVVLPVNQRAVVTAKVDAPTAASDWGAAVSFNVSFRTAATLSSVAVRDGNANLLADNFIPTKTPTTTAAGTTTLTIDSSRVQEFTGTSTQTVKLPTTSITAGMAYDIINNSSGVVTVQSSGANTITTVAAGAMATFKAKQDTPTTAAHWGYLAWS